MSRGWGHTESPGRALPCSWVKTQTWLLRMLLRTSPSRPAWGDHLRTAGAQGRGACLACAGSEAESGFWGSRADRMLGLGLKCQQRERAGQGQEGSPQLSQNKSLDLAVP